MRRCVRCGTTADAASWECLNCHFEPSLRDGFPCFEPAAADVTAGYDADLADRIAEVETGSFWFEARAALISSAVAREPVTRYLEVGCGHGQALAGVRRAIPNASLWATDILLRSLAIARQSEPDVTFFQASALNLPFSDEFDCAGMYDVVEHLEDDQAVFAEVARTLRPGGRLVVTVPQHPFLWSGTDVEARHVRRYTRASLRAAMTAGGLVFEYATSFVSLLLPGMLLQRRMRPQSSVVDQLQARGPLNSTLAAVMTAERALIGLGFSFPAGGSLLAIGRRPPG
jgi:ubiquinone/menaquinone biosynthesis C-methylase UbiE